jgi:RNA polymerase sigma factor (TIGR02999 family)
LAGLTVIFVRGQGAIWLAVLEGCVGGGVSLALVWLASWVEKPFGGVRVGRVTGSPGTTLAEDGTLPIRVGESSMRASEAEKTPCAVRPGASPDARAGDVAGPLVRLRGGDQAGSSTLLTILHGELRQLAASWFRTPHGAPTLQPTALVNEAMVRLMSSRAATWQDREQFMAVAATAMRHVLIDHARKRKAQKRGGPAARRVTLHTGLKAIGTNFVDVLALDEVLERLATLSERQARLVELRVFAGLTIEETAKILDVGITTVKSDWLIAKTWLKREFGLKP